MSNSPLSSPDTPPPPPRSRWRHAERLFWTALFAGLIFLQWPMLKGWVYRTMDEPPPAASFEWRTSLEPALAEAQRDGRPVFVDFHASWCPPCIAMAHDVWPDPAVGRLLTDRYVAVSIDVDDDPEGAADRYDVRAIPTILVLAPDGRVLRRGTYMSRAGMVRFLEEQAVRGAGLPPSDRTWGRASALPGSAR
jgi:thiol:disulfide interchange protein